MQQLKERILREGRVLPGNIIKVDGFLNHRVDTALMRDLADEFAKYFFLHLQEKGHTAGEPGLDHQGRQGSHH